VKRRGTAKSGGTRTLTAALSVEALEAVALRYLAGRDRTEAQIRAYLLRKGASSASLRLVLRRLRDCGYLNDEAYAQRWAESRLVQRPMGRQRLEAELSNRGIPASITIQVLDRLYADLDEVELARRLLVRRPKVSRRSPELRTEEQLQRPIVREQLDRRRLAWMTGMLRRYGFSTETIDTVLGQPENAEPEA
jgi:regulatory protein